MDAVAQWVVHTLATNSALAKVGGRVYPSHLADVPNPVYPCVTFARHTPGYANVYVPIEDFRLVFGFHSNKTRDEAWELYQAAKPLLEQTVAVGTASFRLRFRRTPIDDTDTTGQPVYRVIVEIEIRKVG
jgi:hypothetical protein